MECNKEEAARAKENAEKKMISKDFPGARKIVLEAQELNSDLENISQMLLVCDVHCAADKKIFGNELDWYGMLQIEQTADEATIKKRYSKFAVLLHPDKNKFPGAEAALKLIGEAQSVLLDQTKRLAYDMKFRVNLSRPVAATFQQSQRSSGNAHATAQNNFSTVRYQYYMDILHRTIRCQACDKSIAYDSGAAPQGTSQSQPKEDRNQGTRKAEQVFPGKFRAENPKSASSSKAARVSHVGTKGVIYKRGKKRSGESIESFDTQSSCFSDVDILIDENIDAQAGNGSGFHGENVRRSGRREQEVLHKENLSDIEGLVNPLKRAKVSGLSIAPDENGDTSKEEATRIISQSGPEKLMKQMKGARSRGRLAGGKKGIEKLSNDEAAEEGHFKKCSEAPANGAKKNSRADLESHSSPSSSQEPEILTYSNPDFNDFDKDRKEGSFAAGQIWAVYDSLDAMPRFYARIREVFSPVFKLRVSWLEADPDDENEIKWIEEELPASCGKFIYGDFEYIKDCLMFSHQIYWQKGILRDAFYIYPLKGETWALFKNWEILWKSDAGTKKKFEYEIVKILSHLDKDEGILVACLFKVKGFVSVFCGRVDDGIGVFRIAPSELFRFSHRIPSCKLSGKERTGVPKNSFELDPASLPTNLEEISVPEESRSCFLEKVEQKISSGKNASSISDNHGDALKKEAPKFNSQSGPEKMMEQMEGARSRGRLAGGKKGIEKLSNDEAAEEGHPKKCSEAPANGAKNNSSADLESNSSHSSSQEPELHSYPDPDFNDFDKDRKEGNFAAGQIWAVYDTLDAMPRFYARIRKVFSSGFKVKMTWLEPDPDDENQIKWVGEDLPASCGKFKYGDSENIEDRLMFSHPILWEKGTHRDAFQIHPLKGETWALFKNWDIKWYSDAGTKKKFEYEFVEILSPFDKDEGILVVYLSKVKGFVSVFCRRVDDEIGAFKVPPSELFRFSHRIPSFRLSGKERTGVPKESFELDPASLPTNLEEISVPEESRPCFSEKVEEKMSSEKKDSFPASPREIIEYPGGQFYSFYDEKSQEKFQAGQIWALYCDEDGLPKYYGQIIKVETNPVLKLHLKWLTATRSSTIVQWRDKEMLVCCGRFRLRMNSSQEYSDTSSFSHQLKAVNAGRKNEYEILPRKGEVWALYKNWNANIELSDLENWEYDFVEVMDDGGVQIKVMPLERVNGFNSVFKAQKNNGESVELEVPRVELLRFSHQLPCFRLTDEKGGSLRGFWELDPAALPLGFFA